MGTPRTPSPPSPRFRRYALLFACLAFALAGCAGVGKLQIPQQTVAPVESRLTPGSGEEARQRGEVRPIGPIFGRDTLIGFIPGTADSSRRYLGRLRGGFTVDTLNFIVYGDNRPGYRTSRLTPELQRMQGIFSLSPKKIGLGLITIPVFLFKGFFPDLALVRDTPALITKMPTWGREQVVVNAILEKVDSVQARGQAVSLAVNTGDLVKDGRRPKHWERFLRITQPLTSRVAYFPVAGNHERTDTPIGIENWRTATGLPVGGDRLYYCFDTADGWFRVIALDTNPIVDIKNLYSHDVHVDYSKEQFDWVVARVREHTGPAMILMHHPPFSAGFHRTEWEADQIMRDRRSALVRALHESGISVIASGHEHAYERALMKWPDAVLVVLATGGAGAPLHSLPEQLASAELFSEYDVGGGKISKNDVLVDVAFHYIHFRLWFGGGEFFTYAVGKDGKSTLIDHVQIDLKRFGTPKVDQKKMPIPEQPGPKEKGKNEGENKPVAADAAAKADTSAASERILSQPAPATTKPVKKSPVKKAPSSRKRG